MTNEKTSMTRRLGRGLNALLGNNPGKTADDVNSGQDVAQADEIHVELIDRNPFQPRKDFDAEALQELAESIKQHGLLQPILVRPHDGQYQLIAGERRWLASKKAGLETIPCRVMDLADQDVFECAIEENLKRQDLNVLEKAQAFREYLDKFGSTQEELAKKLSLNRATVANMVRLLDLSDPVKEALRADRISGGHARALLPLDAQQQMELCKEIESSGLSVRKTEAAVKKLQAGENPETISIEAAKKTKPEPSAHVLNVQQQLQDRLGLKVEIKQTGDQAGRVVIHFTSHDDFERLLGELRAAA